MAPAAVSLGLTAGGRVCRRQTRPQEGPGGPNRGGGHWGPQEHHLCRNAGGQSQNSKQMTIELGVVAR